MRQLCFAVVMTMAGCSAGGFDAVPLQQANFSNGGFEAGTLNGWLVTPALWGTGAGTVGFANFPPRTFADLNLTTMIAGLPVGTNLSSIVTAGVPAELAAADTLRLPFSGTDAAKVNSPIGAAQAGNHNSNILTQSMTTTISDVDVTDGKIHIRFAVAPVLNNPTHNPDEQPYFFVDIFNTTRGVDLFNTFNFSGQPGVQWKTSAAGTVANPIQYTDWQALDIAPGPAGIQVGDLISATVVGTGCSFNAHFGEIYVDEFGTTFPAPTVNVQAPAFAVANANLTYTVTAKNNSAGTTTNTIVDFTTPVLTDSNPGGAATSANTTWVSTSAGAATCTNPTAGTAGTVVCNVGTLAPGASFTFTVTVKVPVVPAGSVGTDYVNEGTYDVHSDQTPITDGGLVQTRITASKPIDLKTTLSDGVSSVIWGQNDTYTLTVTNSGPNAVTNVPVVATRPAQLGVPTSWTCVAAGGATCGAASGTNSDVNTTANLPVGGSVTYTIHTAVVAGTGNAQLSYSATASAPAGFVQSVPFDNVGVDTDTVSPALFTLTVNKSPASTGTGSISSEPSGIACGATCAAQFAGGTNVALTALPAAGSSFTGWSGGACSGLTNPCLVTMTAATTVTARFDVPRFTTGLVTTSNGGSQNLRPGDTADFSVAVLIPPGATLPLKVTDTFPAGLGFVSATTPVVTGTLTCSDAGGCALPTQATVGAATSWDFGTVKCTAAAACEIDFTVRGRVAATATRGTTLVDAIAATGMASQNQPTLTVIEPNLTVSRTDTPAAGLQRGSATTVTVTLADNTGGANSDAFDVVVGFPIPANFTGGNYLAGSCPGATAVFTANTATFTLPAGNAGKIAQGTSCTFTYDLTAGAAAPGNSTITLAAGTATSHSIDGAAPPAKSYSAAGAAITVGTAPIANGGGCLAAAECVSVVCDSDHKCGFKDGDGPCGGNNSRCRSGSCSTANLCAPMGGCLADSDCNTATQFCNTQSEMCTLKLPNASPVPTLTGHTPALTGACSAQVGIVVCVSGVCDSDNECGYPEGHGPCTPGASPVCRSGFCGGDNLCGPMGGCLSDADCDGATQFCNTESFLCTPKLPNASPVPTISGHTPPLTGSCDSAVGMIVCQSAVCDPSDNECGYKDGDGPCDGSTAATVCRSGFCAAGGVCGPVGGCLSDADCDTATQFCNTETRQCTEKLPNASPVPTISGHTPPLTGSCSNAVGVIVCQSAVCDPSDNECGYKDGDGSCDASNAATVCRSGTCGADGKCGPPGCRADSDCGATQFCNTETHACVPKLPNGAPVPGISGHTPPLDGQCTTDVGAAVCQSAVCDDGDNLCGYKNGDGSCDSATAATVCRSGDCAGDGRCGEPTGGPCASDTVCRTDQCAGGTCGGTTRTPGVAGGGFTCQMGGPERSSTSLVWLLAVAAVLLGRRKRGAETTP